MQSASDRDEFVEIKWENIKKKYKSNFDSYKSSAITHFDNVYDYNSIMHYPENAFSKNNKDTIVPRVSYSNQ